MVEQIKCLGTELNSARFRYGEVLEQRQVEHVGLLAADVGRVRTHIPESERRRLREDAGVEHLRRDLLR